MGRPAVFGLVAVAVIGVLYPAVASDAGNPLAAFVLAPLGVAVVGTQRDTGVVAVAAFAVAFVEGWAGELTGVPLGVRLLIVALGGALATFGAAMRSRREQEVVDLEVQRAVLTAFQEGLVPVPAPPQGIFAVSRYRPAEVPLRIGGDFVDVISLSDGAAGFIIGDVCGHGPRAAAFGARIRAAWKGIAWTIPQQPARWLEELDHAFFDDRRFDGFVTAFAGRLSPGGEVQAVCAGHPPPLLLTSDTATPLAVRPDVPLGIDTSTRRRLTTFHLGDGTSMLLYTDGLIENSRSPGGRPGEEGLLAALADPGTSTVLDDLLTRFGPDGFDDDVAMLHLGVAGRSERTGP